MFPRCTSNELNGGNGLTLTCHNHRQQVNSRPSSAQYLFLKDPPSKPAEPFHDLTDLRRAVKCCSVDSTGAASESHLFQNQFDI